jgi:alpha-tubulin suppressor-like RCC1 family protein
MGTRRISGWTVLLWLIAGCETTSDPAGAGGSRDAGRGGADGSRDAGSGGTGGFVAPPDSGHGGAGGSRDAGSGGTGGFVAPPDSGHGGASGSPDAGRGDAGGSPDAEDGGSVDAARGGTGGVVPPDAGRDAGGLVSPDAHAGGASGADAAPRDATAHPDLDAAGPDGCLTGPDERCNGLDDDCDGRIDEGYAGLGAPCGAGAGACAGTGRVVCSADGAGTVCDAVAGAPGAEVCDGLDNDCDGAADEGLTVVCFDGPAAAVGVGVCRAGASTCVRGGFGPCAGMVQASDEVCDGLDDDCDGAIDEDTDAPCYDGPAGTEGVADCHAGVRTCVDGAPGACMGQVLPADEICDGVDDDCDGATDEGLGCACLPGMTQPCYAGPPNTAGVGACRAGRQTCVPDGSTFGPCLDQTLPSVETCNDADDDCDGVADDVDGVDAACTVGVGACAAHGVEACSAEGLSCDAVAGAPAAESCNGEDDDCDGRTDEDFDLGAPCLAGTGACETAGQVVCAAGIAACSAVPGRPRDELCNDVDDDCDGRTDEDLGKGDACAVGIGACRASGTRVCAADGRVVCDAVAGAPQPEACNGVDDDCDGTADDGVTRSCYRGPAGTAGVGACAPGTQVCVAGSFGDCAGDVLPAAEACNGIDDDCDGRTDEQLTRPCYDGPPGTDGVGQCAAGVSTCRDGRYGACEGAVRPAVEACDGADDDCDGDTDEETDRACYTGPANTAGVGLCHGGTESCANGAYTGVCNAQVTPAAETCDNSDEDCDGQTDESVTRACYRGPAGTEGVGLCRGGTSTCAAGQFGACNGDVIPAVETCNGADDDCDGDADEETDRACYTGPPNTAGVGPCHGGIEACSDGAYTGICVGQALPAAESCNNTDDDCDGRADEGADRPCYDGPAGTAGVGRCLAGTATCVAGQYGACAGDVLPAVETCNGVDDDCDGRTDEDTDRPCYAGPADSAGVGACHAGTESCANGAYTGVCNGQTLPAAESCNDADDDCDGRTDEGADRPCYDGPAGTAGVGLCHAGTQACAAGQFGACQGEALPAAETCNTLDEDCDGTADDGFGVGRVCTAGVGACLRAGTRQCDGRGGAACNAVAGAPGAETCNGLDDDCDGRTDEGLNCLRVSSGNGHNCAVLSGGRVKCWGDNSYSALGLGDQNNRGDNAGEMGANLPFVNLGTGRTATVVSAGNGATCAILDNQTLKCWGYNLHGFLGLGNTIGRGGGANQMGDNLPAINLGVGRSPVSVAVGRDSHTCVLLDNGTVKCWGYNAYGQLGLGDVSNRGDSAGEMGDALPAVDLGLGRTASAIAVGADHSCALLDDATVKCWGYNEYGQLGLGDRRNRGDDPGEMGDALPAVDLGTGRVAIAITAGAHHTCALLDNATMKCWGWNLDGQLGVGTGGVYSAIGWAGHQMGDALPAIPLGTGRTVRSIGAGYYSNCALLDNGAAKCWGDNGYGQAGIGNTIPVGTRPGQMGDNLQAVDLGTGRSAAILAVGHDHVCAVLDNGTLKCWGHNGSGSLGLGDVNNRGDVPGEMGDALPAVQLQ